MEYWHYHWAWDLAALPWDDQKGMTDLNLSYTNKFYILICSITYNEYKGRHCDNLSKAFQAKATLLT